MIQTYTYRTLLDGKDGEDVEAVAAAKLDRMTKVRRSLLGYHTRFNKESFWITLRVTGTDRWRIAGEARKIMSFILASQRLQIPGGPELIETPVNRRGLTAEQGRVPRAHRT